MNKLNTDYIFLDFLSPGNFKDSRFQSIERIFLIIFDLLAIEKWKRKYKKMKVNGNITNLEYLNKNPQKLLEYDSNYYDNFSFGIIKKLFRKIYIENLNNIGRAQ